MIIHIYIYRERENYTNMYINIIKYTCFITYTSDLVATAHEDPKAAKLFHVHRGAEHGHGPRVTMVVRG